MAETTLQDDPFFQKMMTLMNGYTENKLKLQQLRRSGEKMYSVQADLSSNIKYFAKKMEEAIMEDSENQ